MLVVLVYGQVIATVTVTLDMPATETDAALTGVDATQGLTVDAL